MAYALSILLVIASNFLYHVAQKSVPIGVNPAVSLLASYVVALIGSLALLWVFPLRDGVSTELTRLAWPSFAIGAAAVGLEAGFLLAYRAGWNVGTAALYANLAVTILLLPVGLFVFREKIGPLNAIGVVLAAIGLVLMSLRGR